MLGRFIACPQNPMGETTDRFFLRPHQLLSASEVDVYDAINLVVYAKLPLKNVLRGKSLVAGFIRFGEKDFGRTYMAPKQRDELLGKFEEQIAPLRYPVSPRQYEPLLENMVEAGETALPFFFHEHHQLVDRRRRSALFYELHVDLVNAASRKEMALQITDSERTYLVPSGAWMTRKTFNAYLDDQGVTPWWNNDLNVKSHARLERILLSDALRIPDINTQEAYDDQHVPSFLFGEMLLRRSQSPRGYARSAPVANSPGKIDSSESDSDLESPDAPRSAPQKGRAPEPLDTTIADSPGEACSLPTRNVKAQRAAVAGSLEEDNALAEINRLDQQPNSAAHQQPQAAEPADVMLTKNEVADLLGVSANTVDNYRNRPNFNFPKAISYGLNTIRWKRSEIMRWIDQDKSK